MAVLVAQASERQGARVASLLLALLSGLTLPDIDQFVPLLDHRDALTHSVLPALVLLWWPALRAVAAGLALGLALHLAADCFPAGMVGFATVKLPYFDSLGRWSYLWLAANVLAGTVLFGLVFARLGITFVVSEAVLVAATLIGATYLLRVPGGWWALGSIVLIGWGVSKLSTR